MGLAGCTTDSQSKVVGEDAAGLAAGVSRASPSRWATEVVGTYPHDAGLYTQGLILRRGLDGAEVLIESHGGYGRSGVRRYALSGAVEREERLSADLFAEGIEAVGNELFQLTWRAGRVFVRDAETLEVLREERLVGEGWGIAYDGELLWISNGTHLLSAHDPDDFSRQKRIAVYRGTTPQTQLNELEWAEGALYANVYQSDEIVRIDIATGRVEAVIDAAGLLTEDEQVTAEVLNGIAFRPSEGTFLLTGKYWPRIFEVRFEEVGEP